MPGDTAIARSSRRGECPSVHEPFLELDGALVRIRVPGGLLALDAARAIAQLADSVGAGSIEITNRANLQLRGVPPSLVAEASDALVAAGVARPDVGADERRNVLASPLAGVDPTELIDPRELVAAVDGLLASDAADGVAPKFGVVVDGGGAVHVRGRALDVALGALRCADGTVRYEARLADALPLDSDSTTTLWSCAPDDALRVVTAVVEVCRSFGRARALLEASGAARAWEAIADRAGGALVAHGGPAVQQPWSGPSLPAVGVHRQRQTGFVAVGAIVRLGRLDATTLERVVALADRPLRLSPARGIVVTDVPESDAAATLAHLDALGLVTDPDHPANSVIACVGNRGCAAGAVDTLTDADALVDALAALPAERRPRSVHVSGCEKGCASPLPTQWTLVGGPESGTYTAHCDGVAVAHGLDGASAVALVTSGEVAQ